MNPIGIMQGRLSPPVSYRLQAFPWTAWQQEFINARACQIDLIEWLFEADRYEQNPIWQKEGIQAIREQIAKTGTQVMSCCADYFMPHPFFRVTKDERQESIRVLNQLIQNTARVGIRTILVPVLEVSEIRTPEEKEQLLDALQEPLTMAAQEGISLGLETELSASEYLSLVEDGESASLGIYYDTGNHAALGHDIAEDVKILAPRLVGIHVKDRKRGGSTVLLGEGSANFDDFFKVVTATGYQNPVILQTAFGPDYLGIARRHRQFVSDRLESIDDPIKRGLS